MPKKAKSPLTLGAIDLGSNSAHLIVAESDRCGKFRIIDSEKVYLRLARELDADGNLSTEGISATVDAFCQFKDIAQAYTKNIRAVATFAAREAKNHQELLEKIFKATGIRLEIIDGNEEARLEYLGVREGLPVRDSSILLVDIGGGSTEAMVVAGKQRRFRYIESLRLGAVTMSKKFFGNGKVSQPSRRKLERYIDTYIKPYRQQARGIKFDIAVASSGTAKAIATVAASFFEGDELSDPNGHIFSIEQLSVLYREFCKLGEPKAIRAEFGLDLKRAEIIVAGAAILLSISKLFDVKQWMVSTYSLREGLVVDSFSKLGEFNDGGEERLRWNNVVYFGEHFNLDKEYASTICDLSLQVYDSLCRTKILPSNKSFLHERELLKVAAYLTETGKAIGFPRHHKYAAYIVANSSLMGFTQYEKIIISHIVRFHRRSIASKSKALFCPVLIQNLHQINLLAACLRTAVCLNRTRSGRIAQVKLLKAKAKNKQYQFMIQRKVGARTPTTELRQLKNELSALQNVFGIKLGIEVI